MLFWRSLRCPGVRYLALWAPIPVSASCFQPQASSRSYFASRRIFGLPWESLGTLAFPRDYLSVS